LDLLEAPPLVEAPLTTPVEVKELRLDIACGQVCADGFVGVDIADVPGVKYVHDLNVYPWPFADSSVSEARCSHYLEHLDGDQRIDFFNELYRILKPGAGAMIVTPYAFNERALGDPTHKSLICQWTYFYFDKQWREANKLTHGPYARIKCDFAYSFPGMSMHPFVAQRSPETQAWMREHFVNAVADLMALVIKRV
jgi:hypothetical protein